MKPSDLARIGEHSLIGHIRRARRCSLELELHMQRILEITESLKESKMDALRVIDELLKK